MSYTLDSLMNELMELFEDDFTDFEDQLPIIITRAETRVNLDLGLELNDVRVSATYIDGDMRKFMFNREHVSISSLWVRLDTEDTGQRKYLVKKSEGFMRVVNEQAYSGTSSEIPKYYGLMEPDGLIEEAVDADLVAYSGRSPQYTMGPLHGYSDAVYGVEATLHVVPESLESQIAGTWVSMNLPDLLLASCLVEVERRNKGPNLKAREEEYQRLVIEWSGMSNPNRKRDGHDAQRSIGQ